MHINYAGIISLRHIRNSVNLKRLIKTTISNCLESLEAGSLISLLDSILVSKLNFDYLNITFE